MSHKTYWLLYDMHALIVVVIAVNYTKTVHLHLNCITVSLLY